MLWNIELPQCSVDIFNDRNILEVLYEFDGPKIFITSIDSLHYLWYESGEDADVGILRYLVVPTDPQTIAYLKDGTRTVHDALSQPWVWAVDVGADDQVIRAWAVQLDDVPQSFKPEPGTALWPQLEPLLSYRLIGSGLREGCVPSSVAARALERPTAALKKLLELMGRSTSHGRPEESMRRAYDLPAKRIAFNSFEVSFGMPNETELPLADGGKTLYQVGSEYLGKAFDWLKSDGRSGELDSILLEVLKELVPPAHGLVVESEVRGQMIAGQSPVRLTRKDRQTVNQAISLKKFKERELLREEGRIGEFDKDQLSFILRDRLASFDELKCSFTEEQFDDLYEAFDNDRRVVLLGKLQKTRNVLEVLAAEPVQPN